MENLVHAGDIWRILEGAFYTVAFFSQSVLRHAALFALVRISGELVIQQRESRGNSCSLGMNFCQRPSSSHNSHAATAKGEPVEVNKRVEGKPMDYKQLLTTAMASGFGGGSLFVSTTFSTVYILKHYRTASFRRHFNDPNFPRRSLERCTPE